MDVYAQIAVRIIKSQEAIIGPIAIEQAGQVANLQVNWAKEEVSIKGDHAAVIDKLIEQYKQLFGQISVEVSREAAGSLVGKLPANALPKALK